MTGQPASIVIPSTPIEACRQGAALYVHWLKDHLIGSRPFALLPGLPSPWPGLLVG